MKRFWSSTEMSSIEDRDRKRVALVERNFTPNGVELVNPNGVGKKTSGDIVELAMEIENADNFVKARVCNKLQVIAEQMRFLQKQAHDVLLEAKKNHTLHHAACNFKKIPGNIYYLYKRPTGQEYFSMLSPQEWQSCPHEFLGGFKLELDQSWTPANQIGSNESEYALLNKILNTSSNVLQLSYSIDASAMET